MAKRKLNKVKLVKANARERVGQPKHTQVRPNKKRDAKADFIFTDALDLIYR